MHKDWENRRQKESHKGRDTKRQKETYRERDEAQGERQEEPQGETVEAQGETQQEAQLESMEIQQEAHRETQQEAQTGTPAGQLIIPAVTPLDEPDIPSKTRTAHTVDSWGYAMKKKAVSLPKVWCGICKDY